MGTLSEEVRTEVLCGRICDLEIENAKLRELIRDMWEYIYIGTAQDGQSLHDRTRELGIKIAKSGETEG